AVNITDLYLQYTKIPKTVLTIGQHKAPFGLESNNSDNYNTFLERGMFTNAFGNAGAERGIGLSVAYAPKETINLAVGAFGDNESIGRSSGAPVTNTPDERWGFQGACHEHARRELGLQRPGNMGAGLRHRQDRPPWRGGLLPNGAQKRRHGRCD